MSPLTLNEIKAVIDGVVAAAQWTSTIRQSGIDRLVANLARAGIVTDRDTVAGLLQDSRGAGAGCCRDGIIAKDGRIDPDDHLVVAGLVHVTTASTPGISAAAGLSCASRAA